jgi:adenylylsulfate reductase subunit A
MSPAQTLKLLEDSRAQGRLSEAQRPVFEMALAEAASEEELFELAEAALAPKRSRSASGEVSFERPRTSESDETLKVEIGASEPYVQGGHAAGGYWVDTQRRSTIDGLWAIGDAAGGAPQKYVTGSLAEGEIAALSVSKSLLSRGKVSPSTDPTRPAARLAREAACELRTKLSAQCEKSNPCGPQELTEALQKTMDQYAGGISSNYRYNQRELKMAAQKINGLIELTDSLTVPDQRALIRLWETKEALVVARSLIAHLEARQETRWPGFGEYSDYPEMSDQFLCYVNSVFLGDRVITRLRPLVKGDTYSHPGD